MPQAQFKNCVEESYEDHWDRLQWECRMKVHASRPENKARSAFYNNTSREYYRHKSTRIVCKLVVCMHCYIKTC